MRPEAFKRIGLVFAFGSAAFFATRDNVVRHLAHTREHVSPELAAAATIVAGGVLIAATWSRRRGWAGPVRGLGQAFPAFAPSGVVWGLSYVIALEALPRGRVSVVSPLVAVESLVGVLLSALVLGRRELVGRHVIARGADRRGRHHDRAERVYPRRVIVAHLDLDAFFAAVEELEDPRLRRVPLVVGGDPRGRGVVARRTTRRGGSASTRR